MFTKVSKRGAMKEGRKEGKGINECMKRSLRTSPFSFLLRRLLSNHKSQSYFYPSCYAMLCNAMLLLMMCVCARCSEGGGEG